VVHNFVKNRVISLIAEFLTSFGGGGYKRDDNIILDIGTGKN
jgi:hypothetical protein